jgi:hypothetical protein
MAGEMASAMAAINRKGVGNGNNGSNRKRKAMRRINNRRRKWHGENSEAWRINGGNSGMAKIMAAKGMAWQSKIAEKAKIMQNGEMAAI